MEIVLKVLESDLTEIAKDLRSLTDLNDRMRLFGLPTAAMLLSAWIQIRNVQNGDSNT